MTGDHGACSPTFSAHAITAAGQIAYDLRRLPVDGLIIRIPTQSPLPTHTRRAAPRDVVLSHVQTRLLLPDLAPTCRPRPSGCRNRVTDPRSAPSPPADLAVSA